MIRKATVQDLDAVEKSYEALLSGGPTPSGWVLGVYPTRDWAAENLQNLHVLTEGDTLGASMILNQSQTEDYRQIPWAYPAEDKDVWVVHTLCVTPSESGKGYGKAMVKFAMEEAKRLGGTVMRLDTAAENLPAQKLYLGQGFRLSGKRHVLHQGLIPEELVFLEQEL